jgi:hypothetical protein
MNEKTASEIDEQIELLKNRRRELIRKVWDIDSDILTLREEKLRRFPKRYDDFER